MLAAYAAGEQIIGRQVIEEVADNLDLLPRKDALLANDAATETPASARVLTPEAREELWNNQTRAEKPKPMFKTETPKTGGNGNSNVNSNAKQSPFDDLDDDVSLEIEEVGGFY
jgi:hypothetical protein